MPGKAAPVRRRKDLPQCRFVLVGDGAVRIEVIVIHVLTVALLSSDGPHMVLGGMIEHKIEDQRDARLAQIRGKRPQVVNCAELGIHAAVVADGIAAVAIAGA